MGSTTLQHTKNTFTLINVPHTSNTSQNLWSLFFLLFKPSLQHQFHLLSISQQTSTITKPSIIFFQPLKKPYFTYGGRTNRHYNLETLKPSLQTFVFSSPKTKPNTYFFPFKMQNNPKNTKIEKLYPLCSHGRSKT